jgi:sec-independent protein translocase protein TatA
MIGAVWRLSALSKLQEAINMEFFQPWHIIIVVGLAILLFGGKKLPELGKGLGEGLRGFKEGMKGINDPGEVVDDEKKKRAELEAKAYQEAKLTAEAKVAAEARLAAEQKAEREAVNR